MRIALLVSLAPLAGIAAAAAAMHAAKVSMTFEPNRGQAPAEVRFVTRSSAYTFYLASGETQLIARDQFLLRTRFAGANPRAAIAGEALQESTTNYFVGNDPAQWRSAVPNYERVRYRGVYPGVDLVYYGKDGHLEYDWIVQPGANPSKIRMVFEHADRVLIDPRGDLVIRAGGREYRHQRPEIYQEIAGQRVAVAGAWKLRGNEGSFRIGEYDHGKPLVIDPPLIFSTYFGGNGLDYGYAVAVDSIGNTYVTGGAGSINFGIQGTEDVFVSKYNPSGAKMYTTFLGGGSADEGHGIAVDVQGNAYITGNTGSLDFPLKNAIQSTYAKSGDVFVTKLSASGSTILYSTYLGGGGTDIAAGIAIDAANNAYIIGTTFSTDFPTHNAFQANRGAQSDAFVTKINPSGTALVYSTYLGGNNVDQGNGIAVDAAGNAYLAGYTGSTDFPLESPLRGSNQNSVDAFVAKLNPAGSALVYSTFLGGSATDYATAIAVDSSGSAYVTGIVTSDDFPLVNPIDNKLASHAVGDVFLSKLNPAGSGLVFSTYLGGGSEDDAYAIALDASNNVYITGRTNSSDFPLANPIQSTRFAFDMFVTEINAAGTAPLFSTFIGGNGSESGRGIAVDSQGNIHIAGEGTSTDFPVFKAAQGANGGGSGTQDALVVSLGDATPLTGPTISQVSDNLIDGGPLEPGGWFYVKGSNLSDVQRIWDSVDFGGSTALPTDLNGVEVWVNGAPVPVYFISSGQVDAQAPMNISGTVTVQVFRLGLASNILIAPVVTIQPSLYYYQVNSKSYAAAVFFSDSALMGDPAIVPGARKAKPGEIVELYAAGLGPAPSGNVITSPIPITGATVKIGSADASISGDALVAPGQYQINITVPDLPDGEYTITVSIAGKTSPANVVFEISH